MDKFVNFGGHKVTVDKRTDVQNATVNTADFPGAVVSYTVTNGICFVYMQNVTTKSDNNRRIVATGLPKAKLTGSTVMADIFYVFSNSTNLEANCGVASSVWASLSYPVA